MRQLIPLVLSVNTLALMWLVGNERVLGWVLGLAGQAVWFLFIAVFEAWGLLPLAVGLTVVYARNLLRWWNPTAGQRTILRLKNWLGVVSPSDVYVQAARQMVEEPVGWTWEHPLTEHRSTEVFETRGEAWLAIGSAYQDSAVVVPVYARDYTETEMGR